MDENWLSSSVDEFDSEDCESGEEVEHAEGYRDPLKGGTRTTNLVVAKYVGNWKAHHGWRELYQNWRDAIKESNGLGSKKFITKPQHSNKFMLFVAIHPDEETELGYIRFSKGRKGNGTVELTNYNAWLSGTTIGIGSTSKAGKDYLAGHHGEGYKMAAMALLREGYQVEIKASECVWKFFEAPQDKKYAGELCVCIKTKGTKHIQDLKDKYAKRISKGKRLRRGNIWEDVTFNINGSERATVTKAIFQEWTKLALELDPPSEMLETRRGSLILDPRFRDKVFLKGILLEEGRFSLTPFQYGYNLSQGRVDRDRKCLSNPEEQAQLLAEVWAEAVEDDATLLTKYVNMLQSDPHPTDIAHTKHAISEQTTKKIWQHLLDRDPERKTFYYDSKLGGKDVEFIINSLGKDPVPLQRHAWIPLKKYGLLRTPQEQQIHLFQKAPEAPEDGTIYSLGLKRALRAALVLDARTKSLRVVFKAAGKAQLNLLLSRTSLEINETWLDFQAGHEKTPCWLSDQVREEPDMNQFLCDHIVIDLYHLVLEEIKRQGQSSASDSSLYHRVRESLRQMPVMVEARPGHRPGEVDVSWMSLEGDSIPKIYGLDPTYRITLHRESTCSLRRHDLLALIPPDTPPFQTEQVVSQTTCRATFSGLNPEEEYFPMISRNKPQAFFSLAPTPVRPTRSTHIRKSLPARDAPPTRRRDVQDSSSGGRENLYDTLSDGGGEFTDVDMLLSSHSTQTPVTGSRGDGVRSNTLSPTNPPQIHDNQFQQAEDIVARLDGEFDNVHATLKSLRDELSQLHKTGALNARLEIEARDQAKANKEQLAAKELEHQAARAEIKKLRETNKKLDDTNQDAKAKIEALHIRIQDAKEETQDLKKENEELHRYFHLAKQAGEAAEQLSKRSKRARGNNDEHASASSKRTRTAITAREEGTAERAGTVTSTGAVPPPQN
ncbi:hypothetical protein GP486_000004 [Trichoglossum hirsutum]|uniref:Uncharacterized protein n=1 Tax=Trichoglossum hirsutum TaxID=265104 RepID=A0A9P8LJQ5_9PEZI|nr:hypothetical protein GP486_000004 [Trichoglossum hirsutum]